VHPTLLNPLLRGVFVIRDQAFVVLNDRVTVLTLNDRGYLGLVVVVHIGSYPGLRDVIKEPQACFNGAGFLEAGLVVGGNRDAGFRLGGSLEAFFILGGMLSA